MSGSNSHQISRKNASGLISKEINDKMTEGRKSSNPTGINFLLQDYSTSIEYFDKRLKIAKECNDRTGQRRANVNLGNSYLYLEDFDKALYHYSEALMISEIMNDGLSIAQMNFIIGQIYDIKQDYETSIYFHEKHLHLARQYRDFRGQCRAYFILSQLYEKTHHYDKAKKYINLHKALEQEMQESNEGKPRTKNSSRKNLRTESISISLFDSKDQKATRSNSTVTNCLTNPNKKTKLNFMQHFIKKSPSTLHEQKRKTDPGDLVDLVCRMQKSRFDDQRCDIKMANTQRTKEHRFTTQLDEILNTVDRLQKFRLDDQRTNFPNLTTTTTTTLNEQFLDQLVKCQSSRLDDQRAVLVPLSTDNKSQTVRPVSASSQTTTSFNEATSKTLPDDDFFSLLHRLQSRRE